VAPTPTKLKATAGPFKVTLTWREGDGGTFDVTSYSVFRDGQLLASTRHSELRYVDQTALQHRARHAGRPTIATDLETDQDTVGRVFASRLVTR
jgi:hypothetical protein